MFVVSSFAAFLVATVCVVARLTVFVTLFLS
jgi:hypothetical protein